MAKNGIRSGPKSVKSGRKLVDFTVKITVGHGGERGYAQIPHTLLHYFTLINTVLHPSTLVHTHLHSPALTREFSGDLTV